MFSLASLRELYQHMEWADALVWNALLSSDAARADAALLGKLRHLHGTQEAFLKVWRGEEIAYRKDERSLDELLADARAWPGEARTWIETLDDDALMRELSVPWANRFAQRAGVEHAQPTRLGETAFQVVAHSTYHRGQANTLLRQAGVPPPNVDYIAWLWLARPEPHWP